MKRNGMVLAGYYGFGNAGDELLLRSLINQIRKEDPQCHLTVLSKNPRQTRQHFGVQAVNRWNPLTWIAPLFYARRFILGGGGLLQETTGPWNHSYYLMLILLARFFSCETELRATGVDPIETPLNRWWTRGVLNHLVDFLSVRDADSQRSLEMAGVYRNILRAPDLVFQLDAVEAFGEPSGRIAFALSPWSQRVGWDQDLAYLLDRISEHLKVSIDLLLFYPEEDGDLANSIVRRVNFPIRVRRWKEPEDLLGWVATYELVVGMRYHALVLAALAQRPFIGWGFQRKVRSLCRELGQPAWTFERGWDSEAVFRQISEAWRQREILPHRFKSMLPAFKSAGPSGSGLAHIQPSHV